MPRPAGLPRLGRSVPEILHKRTDRTAGLRQRDNGLPWLCRVPTQATAPVVISARRGCNSAGPRGGAPGPRSSLAPHPLGLAAAAAAETWLSWACPLAGHARARRARSARPTGPAREGQARRGRGSPTAASSAGNGGVPITYPMHRRLRRRCEPGASPPRVLSSSTPCQARSRPLRVIPRCLRDGLRPALTAPPRRARQSGRGRGRETIVPRSSGSHRRGRATE
jgi:hypothetical protein